MVKLHLQGFCRTLNMEKLQKFGFCLQNLCSNGGATYIIGEIIAKDNLNIENLMQTFENLLLQNYLTKFLDIAHR